MRWGGIVRRQIRRRLCAPFFLDRRLRLRGGWGGVILPAGVGRYLNQRVLAARVSSRARFDGHDDDAINNSLRLLGRAQRFFVVHLPDRVSAVGDHHHHFSALPPPQPPLPHKNPTGTARRSVTDTNTFNSLTSTLSVVSGSCAINGALAQMMERKTNETCRMRFIRFQVSRFQGFNVSSKTRMSLRVNFETLKP